MLRLNRAERELGADGSALVHEVLILGMTAEQIGQRRGLSTQRWNDYFARRFRGMSRPAGADLRVCDGAAIGDDTRLRSERPGAEAKRLHHVVGGFGQRHGVIDR